MASSTYNVLLLVDYELSRLGQLIIALSGVSAMEPTPLFPCFFYTLGSKVTQSLNSFKTVNLLSKEDVLHAQA